VRRSVEDLIIHRDAIIEKPKSVSNDWLALCDLGIKSMVSNTITLNSGSVRIGDDEYAVAEVEFILISPTTYLGWESLYSSGSAYWQNFGATAPVPDSTGIRRWLYLIGLAATPVEGGETIYSLSVLRYGFLNGFAPANFDVERTG
jgi:hypothetical protein